MTGRDVIFTGPKLKVVYSGCNWNTVVFTMDNSQINFENWLHSVWEWFQSTVRADPVRFKVSRREPTFSDFMVLPSRDPTMYPNELRCRLSTVRLNDAQVCNAVIECNQEKVDPSQVWAGGYMTPIFRLNYIKDTSSENYGLILTLLKAEYEPCLVDRVQNDDWIIDSNTSGSDSIISDDVMVVM